MMPPHWWWLSWIGNEQDCPLQVVLKDRLKEFYGKGEQEQLVFPLVVRQKTQRAVQVRLLALKKRIGNRESDAKGTEACESTSTEV